VTKKQTKRNSAKQSAPEKLPAAELARFLRRLSFLYRDPLVGNEMLSDALAELASNVAPRSENFVRSRISEEKKRLPSRRGGYFSEMDSRKVENFIKDSSMTKLDLIQLAGERFSIPKAKLTKLTLEGVRDAIRAALRNEESLKIISREAQRGGSARSS
jgi:hypothetical protein